MVAVDISPVRHLLRHAAIHPEMVAVNYEGREISYQEFSRVAGRFAAAMRADGIGVGDRVAYLGHNSATFLTTFFASAWIGATFVPGNFRLAGPELKLVLEDCRPDVLVAEPKLAETVDPFVGSLGIRHKLLVDDDALLEAPSGLGDAWESFRGFVGSQIEPVSHVAQNEDDLAALLYTSGTTGRPKGVMLSHGNLWWNWVNVDSVVDTRFGDVSLAVAPLFHIGGFNAFTLRVIARGGTVIIRRTFDPQQALSDLVNFKVNSMFLVPAMLAAVERQPEFAGADLTALRSTIAAGAPVPPALIEAYSKKGVFVQQAWGLTETSPFATYLEASMTDSKLGSCGIGMPYTEVKVVNPATLETLGANETGEFWVRGPNVSSGYWNNPDATQAVFTEDGWFRTGDLGYADSDRYLFIIDRLKDMVISGGENVYPAEIENALSPHEAIEDVAVIGVPHEKWGETVCAVVAFRGGPLSLEQIREYLATRIARYKLPSRLVVVESVLRNGAGKLDKPRIREQVQIILADPVDLTDAPPFTEAIQLPTRKA